MKKFIILTFILASIFLSIFAYSDRFKESENTNRQIITQENIVDRVEFKDYVITVYRDKGQWIKSVLQILKDNVPVYEEEGYMFEIGLFAEDFEGNEYKHLFQDITGNGVKNLVVSSTTGGLHCCYEFRVFELGDEFGFLDHISVDDAYSSHFKDVDKDGSMEFISRDYTYAYWNTSFAGSPAPQIILRYQPGGYVLAADLMTKPIEEASDYGKIRKAFQFAYDALEKEGKCHGWTREGQCLLPDVWMHMLNLIYAGQKEEAWKFLDDKWPYSENEKQWFIYDLKGKLAASWYYPAMKDDLFGYESIAVDRHQEYFNKIKDYYSKELK